MPEEGIGQPLIMDNHVAWLVVSFAIMVVAILARLCDKFEKLEERLKRLEAPEGRDFD